MHMERDARIEQTRAYAIVVIKKMVRSAGLEPTPVT